MFFAKKIKQILLLVLLVNVLASCDKVCFEADQFYDKMHTIYANGFDPVNGDGAKRTITGKYNHSDGGEIIEWQKTGMIASGDYFMLAISGGWTDIAISNDGYKDQLKKISELNSCRLCFKPVNAGSNENCLCGPVLDNAQFTKEGGVMWDVSSSEPLNTNGEQNKSTPGPDCNGTDQNNIDKCTCKTPTSDQKKNIFNNISQEYFIFSRDAYDKKSTENSWSSARKSDNREDCAYKMGVGLYIGLIPPEEGSGGVPPVAYHLASQQVVCPIGLDSKARCIDDRGVDRTKVIYRSPGSRIFKQSKPGETDVYHKLGDEVKLNIYDQYISDDSGGYNVEFMRGVIAKEGDGIMADIVRSFDRYLFGANYFDEKLKILIKKDGMVEFMYKAVLQNSIVKSVISISLVMYISFFGLAFFMGMTDFGKKEVMMRLLKIGLVILFTNANAWQMYNEIIVKFFKNGMDTLVNTISGIFESNMELTVASVNLQGDNSVSADAGRKFIYSDKLIMDLVSTPTITKIFGLFWIKDKGFNFFALIYIPAILSLIIYFIYMVLDVALKYMINILKICIGLALGPVFILFSLFEKTKDMFNNWVAFVASRSLEIVILFTMLHPFLIILDHSFKKMLMFKVCSENIGTDLFKYSVLQSEDTARGIYDWFQYFLKIAALIFITKSVCDRAGYISGQLVSIGGIANADPASEEGRGESGFNMASSISKGIFSLAKTALTNSKISQAVKFAGRVAIRNLTKAGRAGIGSGSISINDMVNNAFKAVGIRNRGLRSYMRDREVDNAFSLVSQEADHKGLEGKERDKYIRQEVTNRMDLFEGENKNRASLLGLDPKNIKKRLDQKLIDEPLKKYIKQQGENLKNQGKLGKTARDEIKEGAEVWANKNLDLSGDEVNRKVSEFFKKTSVKGAMKSASEVTASQAAKYVKHLVSSGDIDKADVYKNEFRKNAVEGKIEKNKQREENKREGGVLFKGAAGLGRAIGIGGGGKTDRSEIKEGPFVGMAREFSGRFDNKVAKERDRFFGLLGYAGMDEGKDFRKFDRKLARELSNSETAKKIKDHNEKNKKTAFDSELSKAVDKKGRNADDEAFKKIEGVKGEKFIPIIEDRTMLRFKEDDSKFVLAAKLAVKVVLSPLYIPANFARKKYNKFAGEKAEFRRLGRESQLSTLRKLAGDEAKEINKKLDAVHKQNLKVDKNTGVGKTDKEKTDALEQLKESKNHKDSIEKVIVMMKRMEKTVKDQEKAEVKAFKDKEIKDKGTLERVKNFFNNRNNETEKALAKADQEKRLKEEFKGNETVFERLSKIEGIKEGKYNLKSDNNLKSEYVKEVNRKINEIKDNKNIDDLQKLEALEALKGDLFISMDDLERKPALKDILDKVIKKDPVDIVSGNNALASTQTPAQVVNDPKSNSTKLKPEYKKQQQLLKDVYEGQKIIAEAEAQNSKVKEEKDIKEKEERDRSRNGDSPPFASAQTSAQAQGGAQTRAQDQGAQAPAQDQGAPAPAQGAPAPAGTPPAPPSVDPAQLEIKIQSAVDSILNSSDGITSAEDRARFVKIVRQLVKDDPNISLRELIKNAKK